MYQENQQFYDEEQDEFLPFRPEIHFDCQDGKAIQLVRITNNNTFEIVPETVEQLLKVEGGVAICSIVGKYRSGKSFLMNKILELQGNKGFQVSSSVNACTKGLWIWSSQVYNDKDNLNIFFMDTEGLDSIDSNNQMDHKLFALSVMLSSYFIYNSTGSINELSINSLALITQLIKTVTLEQGVKLESEYQISQYAPKFLWVLRDVVLEIQDVKGRKVTPKLYLESMLTDIPVGQSGYSRNENSYKIRKAILNFFKNRDCITLIRPVDREEDLQQIQYLQDNQIKPLFLAELHTIRDKIYRNCTQKIIDGVGLNMTMFLKYLEEFVISFNTGKLPQIQTALEHLLESECQATYDKALKIFEEEAEKYVNEKKIEKDSYIEAYFSELKDHVMNYYAKTSHIGERNPELYNGFKQKLKNEIEKLKDKFMNFMKTNAQRDNNDRINNLFNQFFAQKIERNPQSISDNLNDEVFQKFINESQGGDITKTIQESLNFNCRKLLNLYSAEFEKQKLQKQKSIARKEEIEKEQLQRQQKTIEDLQNKIKEIQQENHSIEEQITNLEENQDFDEYQKMKQKNQRLKEEQDSQKKRLDENRGQLVNLRIKEEELQKKKKGLCCSKKPKK